MNPPSRKRERAALGAGQIILWPEVETEIDTETEIAEAAKLSAELAVDHMVNQSHPEPSTSSEPEERWDQRI